MGKPCRKIKYKKRRSSKPVVQITRPPPVSESSDSPSTASSDPPPMPHFGEGEYEDFLHPPLRRPHGTALEALREWVRKQRFLPQDLSDDFLGLFLSATEHEVEAAARRLEKYFYSRQEPWRLFRDRDPLSPENVEIFKHLYVLPMPETTDDGRKIILMGLVKPWGRYGQWEHVKALAMVLDLLIWERDFGFGDFVIVFDGRGFTCPQLLENRVHNHGAVNSLLLDTIPGTLRAFYLLYPPPHVANVAESRDGIWITVVKSLQEMRKLLPPNILPLEFGGNLGHLGDLLGEQWQMHMVQSRDFFVHFERRMASDYQRKLCYLEQVRKGKNWVHQMKLEADEWEYKIRYYERMKSMIPLRHPAFGSQRSLLKPKTKPVKDRVWGCRLLAKKEEEDAKVFEPPKLYNGYAKQIRQARLEEERQQQRQQLSLRPVLELHFHCS